ncbi:MAG: type IV conjugative transfer system protein TraL [Sutterella sp.]|nr:type IV conjugative transfer system protein TraL [Sutterella sp.]
MALNGVHVPNGLDDAPRFLFFTLDVTLVFITILMMGAITNHLLLGAVGGIVAGYWFNKSVGELKGLMALAHWYLGLAPLRRIPKSYRRVFLG